MTTQSETANTTNQAPTAKLRIGLITASIWQRTANEGTFHSVSFERRYRDKEGNWQSSHSFNTDDLLILSKIADQAHSKILEMRAETPE